MSKLLSELLEAQEPMFSKAIDRLERASGNQSADLRLTSEITGKVQRKSKELGLDPHDSTGKELYLALLSLVRKHDGFLAKKMGVDDPEDVQAVVKKLAAFARKMDMPKKVWVLKHSVAKKMLKKMPPKKIMNHLGYRSIDSMIKREKIPEIFAALRFAEDGEWLNKFLQTYKKLKPADFEVRDIEIVTLDSKKWGGITEHFVHKKRHNLTHLKELGVIAILPMPMERMKGIVITVLPLLLHYVNEVRLYSSYFKLQQVRHDFGEVVVDTLIADPDHHAVMAGNHVHWRIIQRYFGKLGNESHPEIFQPHLQPEDLHWRKAEEVLYRMEPALHFWYDLDYVGVMKDGRPVTLNLMDVAISYVNDLPYEKRAIYHFRESLWNEIFIRYMGQKTLEQQVLKQLDNEMVAPELLDVSL
ncbi:MAG: hypothetical protein U5L95_03430 [Candidatus Saccharibacteria bacterium]|nr:hypothetical protein [Candidatus Saccharibacteria bacterium]